MVLDTLSQLNYSSYLSNRQKWNGIFRKISIKGCLLIKPMITMILYWAPIKQSLLPWNGSCVLNFRLTSKETSSNSHLAPVQSFNWSIKWVLQRHSMPLLEEVKENSLNSARLKLSSTRWHFMVDGLRWSFHKVIYGCIFALIYCKYKRLLRWWLIAACRTFI